MPLPPGVRQRDFSSALREFEAAVGGGWVFSSTEDVDLYRDSYSPFWGENEEPVPSAAVAPDTVEQVQAIVRTANRYRIPLWTVSTGKNLGYGGSAPVLSGSVVLDLKRMNRILEVNEKNAYALVEPGVSYFDFYRYTQEHKLRVWMDCPDPGWGSLIGNALDRGGGHSPMRDHFDAHCGMEVVLASGEVVRTGMGAMPNSKTWQQYKYGFGPHLDGMFSQSNFGIVTKMGFWLLPEPDAYLSGTVQVRRQNDIVPLVDVMSRLYNSGTIQGTSSITSPVNTGTGDAELVALRERPGGASVEDLERYGASRNVPYWSTLLQFYGSPKVIAAQWEYAREQCASIPEVSFAEGTSLRFPLDPAQTEKLANKARYAIPSLDIFINTGGRNNGHMFLSPIIPMTGEAVIEAQRVFNDLRREMGGTGPAPTMVLGSYYARSFLILFVFPIEHEVEANRRNRAMFRRFVQVAADHGWGEYRTHTAFMDDVARSYSFNSHALLRLQETIKDALDPNGVLSPGKSGIWPRRLRRARA